MHTIIMKHMHVTLGTILAGLCTLALPGVQADTIPTLYGTGLYADLTLMGGGEVDPHYTLISYPAGSGASSTVYTLNPGYPVGTWMEEGPNSRWVSPTLGNSALAAPGTYVFRTTFDLTGFDPSTATIDGAWAMDDGINDVLLNGVSTKLTSSGFGDLKFFYIGTGFVPGLNTLDFILNNGGATANPCGFRTEFTSAVSPIAANTPVSILTAPTNETVRATSSVTFKVLADGSWPVTYQWKKDGVDVPTGTNAWLVLPNVTTNEAGAYTVTVKNSQNTVVSAPAQLVVNNAMDFNANRYPGIMLQGEPGSDYVVQYSTTSAAGPWQNLTNLVLKASPTLIVDETAPGATGQRFYRSFVKP